MLELNFISLKVKVLWISTHESSTLINESNFILLLAYQPKYSINNITFLAMEDCAVEAL
jgi:hypothetical protein